MRRITGNLTSDYSGQKIVFTLVNKFGFDVTQNTLIPDVLETTTDSNGSFAIYLSPNKGSQKYKMNYAGVERFVFVPQGEGELIITSLLSNTKSVALCNYIVNVDGVETAHEGLLRSIDASFLGGYLSGEALRIKDAWLGYEDARYMAPLSLFDANFLAIDRGLGEMIYGGGETWRAL